MTDKQDSVMKLRPYQDAALQVSKEKYDAGLERQLIQLPTGTGKTPVFANIKRHHNFDKRLLVLVHRDELAEQAKDTIQAWNPGYRVGVEMGSKVCTNRDDVVVAGVQTIGTGNSTRLTQFSPADFCSIVCDEAHHSVAPTYKRIFSHFGFGESVGQKVNRLLLGVTATPNRGDGQGLGQVYDEIVYQMSILQAIREGWLVDVKGIRVKTNTDLSGVSVRAGDFAIGELEEAVNVDARNHLIVQSWLKYGENRQTICFCVDIAHAKSLSDTFKAYGVAAESIWGTDPDRSDKLKYHKAGGLKVLTNCGVLTEGYDDWAVSCIIMARPTKSQLLFVQMAGRGTRLPKGIDNLLQARAEGILLVKEDCLLIDVVDNCAKHSMVTLASIFGLAPKLDMKGKSVLSTIQEFEQAERDHPQADLSEIESLEDIPAQIERIELFSVKWPEEVVANSKLRWHSDPSGNGYYLSIPKTQETVRIVPDILDKWSIKGSVNGSQFEHTGINDLPEAFRVADVSILNFGRGLLTLLRREQRWHKARISDPQRRMLQDFWKNKPELLAAIQGLSRGEASKLIEKEIHNNLGVQVRPKGVSVPLVKI
jgi:ATP-dependent helicase IRC3